MPKANAKKPKRPTITKSTTPATLDALKARAIAAFRVHGAVRFACQRAKIGRSTWYKWLSEDPVFSAAAADAMDDVTDELEQEAVKRAKLGDTTLIIFLLKSRRRELYGDQLKLQVSAETFAKTKEGQLFQRIYEQALIDIVPDRTADVVMRLREYLTKHRELPAVPAWGK